MTNTILRYRFVSGAEPKAQLQNGWVSWMKTTGLPNATRFDVPGILDPNHLDGIGPLRLLAHLPITFPGSPGALNLVGGKVRIKAKLSDDFQANGHALRLWLCRNIAANSLNPIRQTNWCMTGFDFMSGLSDTLAVSECVVSSDPADWTYAGVNASWQSEIVARRYDTAPVLETIADVSATLHIAFVGGRADNPPVGQIDIEWIEIETTSMPSPPYSLVTAESTVAVNPLEAFRMMGAVARYGNETAMQTYGRWLAIGAVGSLPIVQDTKTAAEMLAPIASTRPIAAYEYARLLTAGDGVDRDPVAARTLLALHSGDPACVAMLANMQLMGVGGAVDEVAAFNGFVWAGSRIRGGIYQSAAMASAGRCWMTGQGTTVQSDAQAYLWLSRALKFSVGYLSGPAISIVQQNRATVIARLPAGAPADLDALPAPNGVTNWVPTPV